MGERETRTKTLSLESSPDDVLVHGGGVCGPFRESVGVDGELALECLGVLRVFVEEDLFRTQQKHDHEHLNGKGLK